MSLRRESGVTSVLRSKTLAQAGFTSAEQVKSKKGSRKMLNFVGKRGRRGSNPLPSSREPPDCKNPVYNRIFRRESGVTSVLRSKTLAQAEFTSAEQVKSRRVPAKFLILWDGSEFAIM